MFATDQSVNVAAIQRSGSLGNLSTIPDRGQKFLLHYGFDTDSGVSPSSYPLGTAGLSPEMKRPGETGPSLPSLAKITNV
jgi:hypothetical protein